jgi:DNA-binding NarL/FixJ family response regulator
MDRSWSEPIRVVLADDHTILRQGLALLLSVYPEIQVVGEACTGQEAIKAVEHLTPDVVVMDISMPVIDGLEACRVVREHSSATQVLILTMHESEEYFLSALRVGAAGYILKTVAPTELYGAITTVAKGGAYLSSGLAKTLVHAYVSQLKERTTPLKTASGAKNAHLRQGLQCLTPREIEVLTLVAEGYTSQEIAERLILSIKTVQAHRANITEKLGLHDIAHLVRFALRHRLVELEASEYDR